MEANKMSNNISGDGYVIIPGNGYVTFRLMGQCDSSNVKEAEKDIQKVLFDPFPHIMVNCEHVSMISPDWFRLLLGAQATVKKYNKSMRLINVTPGVDAALKKGGVNTAFKISKTLRDALAELGMVTKKMLDTDFINPFLSATLHVLDVQASVKATAGKICIKKDDDKFVGDVSGVIGIVSESFNGAVIISFPEKTFLKVMSGMLGEEYTEVTKEIVDGTGEIINMIFGQAKVVLNEKGYGIKTALPSVVSGKDHSLTTKTNGPVVIVPFESNVGDFFIEICLAS
jgi:chemotaxis protein CheX